MTVALAIYALATRNAIELKQLEKAGYGSFKVDPPTAILIDTIVWSITFVALGIIFYYTIPSFHSLINDWSTSGYTSQMKLTGLFLGCYFAPFILELALIYHLINKTKTRLSKSIEKLNGKWQLLETEFKKDLNDTENIITKTQTTLEKTLSLIEEWQKRLDRVRSRKTLLLHTHPIENKLIKHLEREEEKILMDLKQLYENKHSLLALTQDALCLKEETLTNFNQLVTAQSKLKNKVKA